MTVLLFVMTVIPLALAAVTGVMAIMDAGHAPNHRRPVRVFEAVICYFFVIIYGMAIGGSTVYALRSGLLTRGAVALLLIALLIDLWMYKRHAQ